MSLTYREATSRAANWFERAGEGQLNCRCAWSTERKERQVTPVQQVVGIGAGGHGRVLLETLLLRSECDVVGFIDDNPALHLQYVDGVQVLGGEEILLRLLERGVRSAFLGIGGVGNNHPRSRLFARVRGLGFHFVNVIHPTAVVSRSAVLGQGVVVMAGAVINRGVQVGDNTIVNTGAIVDHDCNLGDHVHIAPGVVLSGGVRVGAYTHVGTGACVRQNVSIGSESLVGVGAAVVADVQDKMTVVGVPAKAILHRAESQPPSRDSTTASA